MLLTRGALIGGTFFLLSPHVAQAQRHHHSEKHQEKPPAASTEATSSRSTASSSLVIPKGPARVDFDDRLLQGQTNRLGAVYLYQRKDPVLPSLLDRRKSFRTEITRDVLE